MIQQQEEPRTTGKWHEVFKVRSFEVGTQGVATPQSLCRFLQEAAGNHAARLNVAAQELASQDLMWVLSRLRLQMRTIPAWNESIRIETWPTTRSAGIRAHRDFEVFDSAGELIGQAASMWLLLNRTTRRPVKLPLFLNMTRIEGLPNDLLADFEIDQVGESGRVDIEKEYDVRVSDLDYNQHVNNVCYLGWACDSLPLSFIENHRLTDLQISFLNEGQYGEFVISRTAEVFAARTDQVDMPHTSAAPRDSDDLNRTFIHELTDKRSQKVLALVRSAWAKHCKTPE